MQLNERVLSIPDKKFIKRYTKKNNFDGKKADGDDPLAGARPSAAGDDETFDKEVAVYAFNSPESKASLNPLFLNTKSFNMTTNEYRQLRTQKKYDEQMELSAKES